MSLGDCHAELLPDVHVDEEGLVCEGVVPGDGVPRQPALVLHPGVAAVAVILHEGNPAPAPAPLNPPPDHEHARLVLATPTGRYKVILEILTLIDNITK